MSTPIVHCGRISVKTNTGVDIKDITDRLAEMVAESGVADGILSAAAIGSTGSITTIEYEPGVISDLKRAVNELAPPGRDYEHEKAWRDGNGHSHVQAAIIGPSISVPLRNGRLELGTWQQVVVVNHDNRPRDRAVDVTIIGTT